MIKSDQKLNPKNVVTNLNDITEVGIFSFNENNNNTPVPNSVSDCDDPINNRVIVNILNKACNIKAGKDDTANTITRITIMSEIKRLLIICFKNNLIQFDHSILESDIIKDSFSCIELCIDHIITSRDDYGCYRAIITYHLAFILDIFNINSKSKEAAKLVAFINYFIDIFIKIRN